MGNESDSEYDLSKLRERAEEKVKRKRISDSEYELDVHKEELEMQADELRSTQKRLLTSLEEFKQLFNLAPVGYFVLDQNGNILNLNKAASGLIGLSHGELKGKAFSLILNGMSFQDDYYRYRNLMYETSTSQSIESEIIRKDGKVLSVLIESLVVKDEKNKFRHFLTTVVDISLQKENERQLEQALAQERELNDLKSRFVSMASHEFRTPLATMLSSVGIMDIHLKNKNIDKCKPHLVRIASSISNLTGILNDFLSLDKLEHGDIKAVKELVDINRSTNLVIKEAELIIRNGQSIAYTHDGDYAFMTDPKIYHSILLNLLSNASKYSGEGAKIELRVMIAGNRLTIEVKDSGIGIPAEEQDKIFSRLFRAKNAGNIEGAGLGLNILKKHIELLNGKISFMSKENAGSTFIVELRN